MKIKAIVLGLVISGALLLAKGNQGLVKTDPLQEYTNEIQKQQEYTNKTQKQIDAMNINPLDPELIKGLTKAMVRLDGDVKRNHTDIRALDSTTYEVIIDLKQEIARLKKEVAKLKQAKTS
ncbi:hypothetical protein BGL67_08090 [Helicobacter pylori]|uniref:hypothetical protein n=1 Tax=Helicobacter pylori TaxID=210 RepID=UPI0009A2BFE0|nr:hypothetical protein [Helicobacter pylori]NHA60260.1 hypothetical protein [Helicobacter pylori]OPG33021.1 hypothetical protein BGL67_08090 [Helicobacter pylori]